MSYAVLRTSVSICICAMYMSHWCRPTVSKLLQYKNGCWLNRSRHCLSGWLL